MPITLGRKAVSGGLSSLFSHFPVQSRDTFFVHPERNLVTLLGIQDIEGSEGFLSP